MRGSRWITAEDLDADGCPELTQSNLRRRLRDFEEDGSVFWGSSSGYSSTSVTEVATQGAWGEPLIVGAP